MIIIEYLSVMKRLLLLLILSFAIALPLALFTSVSISKYVLNTLYTVAGVIFSVGMSITISPKTDNVTNCQMKRTIRNSYIRVRNAFMYFFCLDTILFILTEGVKLDKCPTLLNNLCGLFLILSIVYYVYNFIQLQELGEQIEDQVFREKQRRSKEACSGGDSH